MSTQICRLNALHSTRLLPPYIASSFFTARCHQSRRAMLAALAHGSTSSSSRSSPGEPPLHDSPPVVLPERASSLSSDASSPQIAARPPKPPVVEKPKPVLRASKAAITLTPRAVQRLKGLLKGPTPQLIRIGVRNKGCAGMAYHLEYVEKPEKFDEVVVQDDVRVLIDSKALFSIIGSEMDWKEDRLSSKFAFKNPNIKDACGCGESFSLGS